jgi:hypothetical protein
LYLLLLTAPAGGSGFTDLAGYIFGGNADNAKMEMTTPVFTKTAAQAASSSRVAAAATSSSAAPPSMQFVIERKFPGRLAASICDECCPDFVQVFFLYQALVVALLLTCCGFDLVVLLISLMRLVGEADVHLPTSSGVLSVHLHQTEGGSHLSAGVHEELIQSSANNAILMVHVVVCAAILQAMGFNH